MTVHIPISTEAEALLRERAQRTGQVFEQYLASLIERLATPPKPLREISGKLGEEFRRSGMTDDELGEMLEKAKHEVRRERRGTA